jgi:hypothetical protein
VAFNMARNVSMFARSTLTDPSFLMTYTDWTVDTDVSTFMHNDAFIEKGITEVGVGIANHLLTWTCMLAQPRRDGCI